MIVDGTETMDRFTRLAAFARVVESGSFSAAAAKLGLSRAATSKHVRQLEEHLGVRLLNRTTRHLSLTEEGAAFYERAQRILAELEAAEGEASAGAGEARGTLRLSAPVSFGRRHLGPAIAEFLGRYPHVQIALSLEDRFADLVEEGLDAAIRIGRLADSSLVARRLCATRLVLAAAPSYWRRKGKPRTLEALPLDDCFVYTLQAAGRSWRFLDAAGKETVLQPRGAFVANNGDVLREAALAGAGIVLLPDFIVGEDLSEGRLETALPGWRGIELGIQAVWPSGRHLPSRLRLFLDFLAQTLSAPSWERAAELPALSGR
jgi:DNA-binding transcriptional LysR family regulator